MFCPSTTATHQGRVQERMQVRQCSWHWSACPMGCQTAAMVTHDLWEGMGTVTAMVWVWPSWVAASGDLAGGRSLQWEALVSAASWCDGPQKLVTVALSPPGMGTQNTAENRQKTKTLEIVDSVYQLVSATTDVGHMDGLAQNCSHFSEVLCKSTGVIIVIEVTTVLCKVNDMAMHTIYCKKPIKPSDHRARIF